MRFLFPLILLLMISCGNETAVSSADSAFTDSMANAGNQTLIDSALTTASGDTEFRVALPPVYDGDIIMENCTHPSAVLSQQLMGGKYNHVGIIFQRKKDGIYFVMDLTDSVHLTPLTEYVDRATDGHVCLLRLRDANKTLTEQKVTALRNAAKAYNGVPADPVLNWDDSHLYASELVWKVYNNAMLLTLCPTRTVADFDISDETQKELAKTHGGSVSNKDEAVSTDDIYNSVKLEVIYEK